MACFAVPVFCLTTKVPGEAFEFVTRKITSGVARIKLGMQKELRLGNLDAERDWGHAKDYVCAMHRMLLQEKPDDFVVATGKSHTVREFCDLAFKHVGSIMKITSSWIRNFTDPRKNISCWAIQAKAKKKLDWQPEYRFEDMVTEMVDADLAYSGKVNHVATVA